MFILKEALKEEKKKNDYLLSYYNSIILDSPKGAIGIMEKSNEKYLYIKYRENDKVITKYYGKLEDNKHVIDMIQKRNHAKDMIKKLKTEKKLLEKMEDLLC